MLKKTLWILTLSTLVFSLSARAEDEVAANGNGSMNYGSGMNRGSGSAQMNYGQNAPMTSLQWMTNFKQAADKAKRENKPMLLFFTGSDWCGWCKKIESEIFADPEFSRAVGNQFVFVELDYPMNKAQPADIAQQNADLKQHFGITGFPTIVLLDANQNFIAETGYRAGGGKQFANYLMQLVQGN